MISNLPRDLAEKVLSRLPSTSLRALRFTCKKLNTLIKDPSFLKKHLDEKKQREEFDVVMMVEHGVFLMTVNLLNPSIDRIGKLISLDDTDRVNISQIFHCDGLLLCIIKDFNTRLVVWNPYLGQTRWVEPKNSYHAWDRYALGHDKYSLTHKVLRFVDDYDWLVKQRICEFEIYNLNSDSWNVVHVNPDWDIMWYQPGVTLKGNTYWYAKEKMTLDGPSNNLPEFLLCFDFTTEKFGPRLPLPLPFHALCYSVTLSSVREKHLAVLFQEDGSYTLKLWISSKIEPNEVSWNKLFLSVDMIPLICFQLLDIRTSFFVDEKKKIAVVLDKDRSRPSPTPNVAYIFGENGYFKQVDLGESVNAGCWPLVCSYVPSSAQINQAAPRGNKNTP